MYEAWKQKLVEHHLQNGNEERALEIYLGKPSYVENKSSLTLLVEKIIPFVLVLFAIILLICLFKLFNYFFNYNYYEYDNKLEATLLKYELK